jgi:hypothetical protein
MELSKEQNSQANLSHQQQYKLKKKVARNLQLILASIKQELLA